MTVPLPARLLIATTNPGKLDEIRGILGAVPVTLVLDRDGRVAARLIGQISDASILETLVRDTRDEA